MADGVIDEDEDERLQPASKFISRGFSRGARTDNLLFLPVGDRKAEERRSKASGQRRCLPGLRRPGVVRQGPLSVCQTCGAQDELAGAS